MGIYVLLFGHHWLAFLLHNQLIYVLFDLKSYIEIDCLDLFLNLEQFHLLLRYFLKLIHLFPFCQ